MTIRDKIIKDAADRYIAAYETETLDEMCIAFCLDMALDSINSADLDTFKEFPTLVKDAAILVDDTLGFRPIPLT
jgi:hypothetical protein